MANGINKCHSHLERDVVHALYRRASAGTQWRLALLPPLKTRLDVTFGHPHQACVGVGRLPAAGCRLVDQIAVRCGQVFALTSESYLHQAIALLAERESDGICMAFYRKPGASLGISQVASGLQFLFAWANLGIGICSTGPAPSGAQGQPLRERPIAFEALVGHEKRARHTLSQVARVNANCTDEGARLQRARAAAGKLSVEASLL